MTPLLNKLFLAFLLLGIFIQPCLGYTLEEKVQMEADYILSCQYINDGHPAHGAINNIYGNLISTISSSLVLHTSSFLFKT